MAHPIVHWELMGADGDAQKEFYSKIFGWKFTTPEGFGSYHTTEGDDMGVNGAVGQGSEEMPSYQCLYVGVENIDSKLEEIEAAGGTTVVPRTEIPDIVTFAMFQDPAATSSGSSRAATADGCKLEGRRL